jgi:hypothetical protein
VVRAITDPHQGNQNTVQSQFSSEASATTARLPSITSISPTVGPVSGGTPVVITGSGFQAGVTVSIGGFAASVSSVAASQITATTAAATSPGTYDVVVTNPDGRFATLNGGFAYLPPLIISLTPASNPRPILPSVSPLTVAALQMKRLCDGKGPTG